MAYTDDQPLASERQAAMLRKLRAILAKAESTEYEAEAMTFMAAARRIMQEYSISDLDVRRLDPNYREVEEISLVRVVIETPYVRAKGSLLNAIALSQGCMVVGTASARAGIKSYVYHLFGPKSKTDLVEMIYSSLLVQCARTLPKALDEQI